jgi:hypothetical protein
MTATAHRLSRRGARMLIFSAIAAIALVSAQAVIDHSAENIYCTIISTIAAAVTAIYCLRYDVVSRFPISSFAVLGFCITTYAMPLVVQTFSDRSLIFNLLVPRQTFEATIAFQAVILAAHLSYANMRFLQLPSRWLAERVLKPIWIFRVPRALEFWALGIMGMGATWVSRILYSDAVNFGDTGGKFLQALVVFIVAPFFIPLRSYFLNRPVANPPLTMPLLAAYFGMVILTAVFFNARAIFAIVVFTVLLSVLMMIAMRRIVFTSRAKLMTVVAAIAIVPVMGVAQDLATAMQVARLQRGQATPMEIAAVTFDAFNDKARLAAMRSDEESQTAGAGYSGLSEVYIQNEFFQRLTYTKYTDLTMAASLRLTEFQKAAIKRDSYEGIVSILPTPMINFLGFDVNKENRSFSTGDVYANLAFNQQLGGYSTGSSITNSIDVLDLYWPVAIFCISIILFIEFDSYTLQSNGGPMISGIAFVLLYAIVGQGLVYESFRSLFENMTRAYVQAIFVYTVLTLGLRIVIAPFSRSSFRGLRHA